MTAGMVPVYNAGEVWMNALVETATKMACDAHAKHRRKWTGRPYVEHSQRVANRAAAYPGSTPEMVAASWLHDTSLTFEVVEAALGHVVAEFVRELTTSPSKGMDLRRSDRNAMDFEHLSRASREARIIKMLDRIDDLDDMAEAPRVYRALYAMESDMLARAIGDADTALRDELISSAQRFRFGGGPAAGSKE